MSWPALTWAKALRVGTSTEKAVLLALAYRHNEDLDRAYPSIASICEFTELNRKTVISALGKLEDKGLIADSGVREGKTKQVIAYRLNFEAKTQQAQKRDTLKTGANSPNFSGKESQKRDTERVLKTTSESKDSSESTPPVENELDLGLPPLPPTDPTPSDVAAVFAEKWPSFATPLRGGELSAANAEKMLALADQFKGSKQTALDVCEEIFSAVDRSDWLQGKVPGRDDRPPFKLSISFLLEKRNFEKVLGGRFDGKSSGERRAGTTAKAVGNVIERLRAGRDGRTSGGSGPLAHR